VRWQAQTIRRRRWRTLRQDWVRGAYGLYAGKFAGVQTTRRPELRGVQGPRQRGSSRSTALQQRDVPFTMRVSDDEAVLAIARSVPDRLTFTADMTTRT